MKIKELRDILKEYNQEAEVDVIAHNKKQEFSLCWGGGDGCSREDADEVSFYCDGLNNNESLG